MICLIQGAQHNPLTSTWTSIRRGPAQANRCYYIAQNIFVSMKLDTIRRPVHTHAHGGHIALFKYWCKSLASHYRDHIATIKCWCQHLISGVVLVSKDQVTYKIISVCGLCRAPWIVPNNQWIHCIYGFIYRLFIDHLLHLMQKDVPLTCVAARQHITSAWFVCSSNTSVSSVTIQVSKRDRSSDKSESEETRKRVPGPSFSRRRGKSENVVHDDRGNRSINVIDLLT